MNATNAARTARDIDVLALATLALAGAFATQPLLHVFGSADESAPSLIARLAPAQTVDRLWVVFVLIPAAIAFVGIGVPYAFRVLIAGVRGRLEPRGVSSAGLRATAVGLVVAELTMGRNWLASLVLTCFVAAWTARGALAQVGLRFAPHLLAVAGFCLVGLAFYERRLQTGGALSIAVAPTLVLAAFYASFVGAVASIGVGAQWRDGRPEVAKRTSLLGTQVVVRTGLVAALLTAAWLFGPRAVRAAVGGSPDVAEVTLTAAAGAAYLVLARVAWRADRGSAGSSR